MKNSKVFLVCLILTIGSLMVGCQTTPPYQPICGPDARPVLEPLTTDEQWAIMGIDPALLGKIADNQTRLKNHILHWEDLARAHNEVYNAACE